MFKGILFDLDGTLADPLPEPVEKALRLLQLDTRNVLFSGIALMI